MVEKVAPRSVNSDPDEKLSGLPCKITSTNITTHGREDFMKFGKTVTKNRKQPDSKALTDGSI